MYEHTHTHTNVRTHTHTHTNVRTHTHTLMYGHTHTHTHALTCGHTHTITYGHTHTPEVSVGKSAEITLCPSFNSICINTPPHPQPPHHSLISTLRTCDIT